MNKSVVLSPQAGHIVPVLRPAAAPAPADRVDPGLLLAFLRRRWPLIVGALLVCLGAGLVITARQTPTYLSTAEVTLDAKVEPIAPLTDEDRAAAQGSLGETYIDTQVEVMTSSQNVAGVVDRLGLAHDPRFREDGATPAQAREAAIADVEGGVTAFRSGATYTISVAFESEDPREAARIANAFAEQYTLGTLSEKEAADAKALREIGSRMETARIQASDDAASLSRYRLAHDLPASTDRSLTEQEISAYNQQVTEARAQSAEDAARLATARRQLGSGSNGDDVGKSLGSGVVASLRQQQAAYAAEIASLSSKYGPRHPDLLRARSQLDAVTGQIRRRDQPGHFQLVRQGCSLPPTPGIRSPARLARRKAPCGGTMSQWSTSRISTSAHRPPNRSTKAICRATRNLRHASASVSPKRASCIPPFPAVSQRAPTSCSTWCFRARLAWGWASLPPSPPN